MKTALRLGYSKKQASIESSLSVRMLDYLIKAGKLKARKVGKRVIIVGSSLEKLLRGQSYPITPKPNPASLTMTIKKTEGRRNDRKKAEASTDGNRDA
jgi:hypothetical protein